MEVNIQKNHRELEIIVQECILNTLRESIPVEAILKAYMDETVEENVVEEIKEQIIEQPNQNVQTVQNAQNGGVAKSQIVQESQPNSSVTSTKVGFNDVDYVATSNGQFQNVVVPKTDENLDYISNMRAEQRRMEEANDDSDDDNIRLNISNESVSLDSLGLLSIEEPKMELLPDLLLDEIEVLE